MTSVKLEAMFPTLGPIKVALYGEDEIRTRDRRKASSRPLPGRFICKCGLPVWSTNHEVGNRALLKEWEEESHTFVRNAYTHWIQQAFDIDALGLTAQCACYGAGKLVIKEFDDTFTATTTPIDVGAAGTSGKGYRAAAASALFGVLVGTGTTPHNFEQNKLITQIVEGCCCACPKEMSHVAMIDYTAGCDKPTYSSCTLQWTALYPRFFNNNSGATIAAAETALVFSGACPQVEIMIARDVFACVACVVNGGQLKVTYTMISPAVS